MTTDEILQAVDLMETAASVIPNCSVVKTMLRSTRLFWGFRQEGRFVVLMKISIGPRGGVAGYVYLRDLEIKPDSESIRIGEVQDFSRDRLLPLAELFWPHDSKEMPSEDEIFAFLERRITRLPNSVAFYEEYFAHGYFDTPASSIRCLEGGATGLR